MESKLKLKDDGIFENNLKDLKSATKKPWYFSFSL